MALIMRDLWLGASRHGTGLVCPAQGEGCNHLCGLQASSGRVSRANEIREDTSHVAPCEGGEIHAFVRIQLTKTLFWLLSMVNPGPTGFLSLIGVCGFATGLDVAPGSFARGFKDTPLSFLLCCWLPSPD